LLNELETIVVGKVVTQFRPPSCHYVTFLVILEITTKNNIQNFRSTSRCLKYGESPQTNQGKGKKRKKERKLIPCDHGVEVTKMVKKKVTDPEWPRRFQEVKVPRFPDNGTGWR